LSVFSFSLYSSRYCTFSFVFSYSFSSFSIILLDLLVLHFYFSSTLSWIILLLFLLFASPHFLSDYTSYSSSSFKRMTILICNTPYTNRRTRVSIKMQAYRPCYVRQMGLTNMTEL
jgi:hypothetical protein